MASLLPLFAALLDFLSGFGQYLANKSLLNAGEAQAVLKGLQDATEAIKNARRARAGALSEFDSLDGVPDEDDPNLRD